MLFMRTAIDTVYTTTTQTRGVEAVKSEIVNLRLTQEQKAAIDYAAKHSGVSRTEFMVQASFERAVNLRYDQYRLTLPKEEFESLVKDLETDISEEQKLALAELEAVKLPWEK
jgi:uncharacterized protein (DUF1778 family)